MDALKKPLDAIGKGKASPVYLLFGDQEYLVAQAEAALVDALVPESDRDFALVVMDGTSADWGEVAGHLRTLPMFGDRKVVVVRDARLAGAGASAANLFNKAREAWADGSESRRKTAAGHLMNLLGAAGWTVDALGKSGPNARSADDWQKDLKVNLNAEDLDWLEEARNFALARGMAPKQDDKSDPLADYLEKADAKSAVLILTAVDVDKRRSVYKTIDKIGDAIELTVARGEKAQKAALKAEIDQMLASAGKKLSPEAFVRLERKTGFDLRKFVSELAKIITYAGDRKNISEEDVEAVVPQTREESIFELTDAVARRDLAAALKLITDLVDQNHHPLEILGAIHREIRNLYLARDYARSDLKRIFEPGMFYGSFQKNVFPKIKEKAGLFSRLHPYVVYKALENQHRFDRRNLEQAFELLAEADLRMKSTRQDPVFVLEELVFRICSK